MSNSYETDIRSSIGAILLGGFGSVALSGVIALQTFVYFRLYYPADHVVLKMLVAWLWAVDAVHTCVITASNWENFAVHYGERARGDYIPTATALTLFFTCVASFSVQSYYAQVLYKLSGRKWSLAAPVVILAFARLATGLVSTIKAVQIRSWAVFVPHQTPVITLGYSLSISIDILVTVSMCWFFARSRSRGGLSSTKKLIDTMVAYTISSGLLTFITTLASMICWFALRGTLVFMSTHFLIGKFYTLALLTSLNTRRFIRERHNRQSSDPRGLMRPVLASGDSKHHSTNPTQSSTPSEATVVGTLSPKLSPHNLPVHVSVERTVRYDEPLIPLRKIASTDTDSRLNTGTSEREPEVIMEYNPYDRERTEYSGVDAHENGGGTAWRFSYDV